jgi:uncharacterized surface protein with fasciclin (FAS1) repeats
MNMHRQMLLVVNQVTNLLVRVNSRLVWSTIYHQPSTIYKQCNMRHFACIYLHLLLALLLKDGADVADASQPALRERDERTTPQMMAMQGGNGMSTNRASALRNRRAVMLVSDVIEITDRMRAFASFADITGVINLFNNVRLSSTVFVPNNEAFEKLPSDVGQMYMSPEYGLHMFDIMSYHINVGSVVLSSHFYDGMVILTEQKLNETIQVRVQDGQIHFVTDAIRQQLADPHVSASRVTNSEVVAANGVVHTTNYVFFPRFVFQSMTTVLDNLDQFDTFVRLLLSLDLYSILGDFTGTILAPTNRAFNAMGKTVMAQLETNHLLLEQLLAYHIINDVFNYEVAGDGAQLSTQMGIPITFTQRYPPSFNGHAAADFHLFATGVIYEMDVVLVFPHTAKAS